MTQSAYQTWQPTVPQPNWQQPYAAPVPSLPIRRVGAGGLVLTLLGAIAVVASFTSLQWFRDGTVRFQSDTSGTFDRVQDVLGRISLATGFQVEPRTVAVQYFSWLGWGLLVAVTAVAVLSNLPTGATPVFRAIGPLLALAAIGLTFKAIDLLDIHAGARLTGTAPTYGDYLAKAGVGFYTALAGFLFIGIGALAGSRERR